MTLLNVPCSGADLASRIVEQHLLLGRSHLAKKVARLLVVIVVTKPLDGLCCFGQTNVRPYIQRLYQMFDIGVGVMRGRDNP
jgi:hypothetical protein